jgi:YD repeat-containing protein
LQGNAHVGYNIRTERYTLASTVTTYYDDTDPTQYATETDSYTYSTAHLQVSSHTYQTSESGMAQTDHFTYPLDYGSTNITPGIAMLQAQNITGAVVERYTTSTPQGGSPVVTQGSVNSYIVQPGTSMAVRDQSYLLETTNPIPTVGAGAYQPLSMTTAALNLDAHYVPSEQYSYDGNGNLVQYFKLNPASPSNTGTSHAIKWSYNNALPVAEAANAAPNEIFYESFETDQSANSTVSPFSHCGRKYWSAASYIPGFVIPDSRAYIIEYWTLNTSNNTWSYNSATYTGASMSVSVAGGSGIDDVRIYPVDAQMKSYTYDTVNGATSSIDVNGRTFNYDYDAFGRLLQIRNDNGSVEKKYQYHYKGSN